MDDQIPMYFKQITDPYLAQHAYLIACQQSGDAIIIDPERDVDRYLRTAEKEGLTIIAALETHVHADFISGTRELASRQGVRAYLSAEGGDAWQYEWPQHGDDDVVLLRDGDSITVGNVRLDVLHVPGHTPEHLSLLVTDGGAEAEQPMGVVTGDFVFVGDLGRPDLLESAAGEGGAMKSSARRLYASARRFLELPDYLQVWPGHGAGSACGKALGAVPQSTVGYERATNGALRSSLGGEGAFVRQILEDQSEPPLYFGRAKLVNKMGPPVLDGVPKVPQLVADDLERLFDGMQLIDTRTDRRAFMRRHVAGALLAPFDETFPTVVGSLIDDPETQLLLAVERQHVDEAVRCLYRIGFDHIAGVIEPAEMAACMDKDAARIETIDFDTAADLAEGGMQVVDVRFGWEFDDGHFPGAVNLPYTRLPEQVDDLPGDGPIIVHCAAGIRSGPASSYLSGQGWEVYYVDDEFDEWRAGHPARLAS